MATESKLIQTSKFLRNAIILFVIISIAVLVMPTINKTIRDFFVKPDPPTTYTFNPYQNKDELFGEFADYVVSEPIFINENSQPIFSTNGDFTIFPSSVYVYKVKYPKETFLTVQNAQRVALALGFESNYETRPNNLLIWTNQNKILEFQKTTQSYSLQVNLQENLNLDQTVSEMLDMNNFLDSLDSQLQDLEINSQDYNLQNPLIKQSQSLNLEIRIKRQLPSTAFDPNNQTAQKYITENNIQTNSDIYFDNPFDANIKIQVYKNATKPEQWVGFSYTPLNFETEKGIYEIISVEEAFEKVQKNQAYLVYISTRDSSEESENNLIVKEFRIQTELTELVYLIQENALYTFPAFLFRGQAELVNGQNADFIIYSPAL